ncbi:hypothetical protein EV189_2635 [Motilibacter rhizosphaerae]|uniref:Uncharacterized protein n=1 Tax=Motilibacter rhizosphaerae TaxID=598652 RepID=A0A4Q7NPK4_9ACTN|nr:hypothetical protein [Motilibacter rhizosphaerae]RZS87211.1 hypothetical protein EV189_2635 [Motilibacter rhizosphaerae]
MTWDIYALRGPGGARNVEQIPEGWQPPAIGTHDEVRDRVRAALPQADLSDPLWVRLTGADWQVEALLGKAPQVHDVSMYVTGDSGEAVEAVLQLARALRVTAYDTETGDILTPEARPPVVADVDDDEERRPWWKFWGR